MGFGDPNRDIPDVSLFAGDGGHKSFYVVCQSDVNPGNANCNLIQFFPTPPFHDFQAVGGTSVSAPAFAGIMTLVNQMFGRQGNANVVLYALAKSQFANASLNCNSSSFTDPTMPAASGCVFYDITKGNDSVACVGGSPNCSAMSSSSFGVEVTGTPAAPAFATATGYDLATGLGTINVANLLSKWAAAVPMLTATSTTLVLSPQPTNYAVDQSVTVSGSVTTGAGGPPTGLVVLEDTATNASIDTTQLTNGSYNFMTTFLPGGSYNVIAHYGGDGTFAMSNSPAVAVNVSKQGSTVQVGWVGFLSNGNPILPPNTNPQTAAYGSPYILRIDVGSMVTTPPSFCQSLTTPTFTLSFVCPTGTISLFDNGSALNDFPMAQTPNATNVALLNDRGFAEDQAIQLTAGTHSITATYSGDNSYSPPTTPSNTLMVTITKAATTITVTANQTSGVTTATPVTFTAVIASQSNSATGATGTVTFLNNGTAITNGTVTVAPCAAMSACPGVAGTPTFAGGSATFTTTFSAPGTESITAKYNGDGNYQASPTSAAVAITVAQPPPFTVGASPSSISVTHGQSASSTITVASTGTFNSTVMLTCSVSPSVANGPTCGLSPSSVTPPANSSVTSTLTVSTAAAAAFYAPPRAPWAAPLGAPSVWALALAALALLLLAQRELRVAHPRAARVGYGALLLLLALAALQAACGGGGGGGGNGGTTGTPPGTYTVTVTGTSSGNPSSSTTLALTVN